MINYNENYLNIHYLLITTFLIKVDKNILDISYSIDEDKITIQVVIIEKSNVSEGIKNKLKNQFSSFDINIIEFPLSKDKFNENKGDWSPKYYQWLDYVLFSKAEII